MAGLEDLPNELLLELLYQCHPRAALALVTASPPVFRVFRWQRSNIIHLYQQRLSVVPQPTEVRSIAYIRLMEAQCDSTNEFEERVRYNWRLAVSSAANLSHNYFIEDWPSDLPMLAVMADICSEVDFLVEKLKLRDCIKAGGLRPYRKLACTSRTTILRAILSDALPRNPHTPSRHGENKILAPYKLLHIHSVHMQYPLEHPPRCVR
ncbi:hypothetical protein PG995_003006 [Apiospora arundinis]